MEKVFGSLPSYIAQKLVRKVQPDWLDPMLATLTTEHFSRQGWIFEPKFDGERCLAFKRKEEVKLYSRNRKMINSNYPEVADALKDQEYDFVVDGEVVAFDGAVTSFARLQGRMHQQDPQKARQTGTAIFYYVFDLLYLDGYDLRNLELLQRKKILNQVIEYKDPLRVTLHKETQGEAYYQEACRKGWEGVIAKRADSSYVGKRSSDWLKFKCVSEQELVIGGYTDPHGERSGFGALMVGYYEGGKLAYAGKVGTGFDARTLRDLISQLSRLEQDRSPFASEVKEKGAHWVKPRLVAQIGFSEWTGSGKLRHPRFLGLRRDKGPEDVIREAGQHGK